MVHLFVTPYRHASPRHNAEMAEAMRRNRNCRFIDKIHEITDPPHPTFRELFATIRGKVGWADVVILANSDIYFDDTAELVHHIGYEECFALSRYEGEQSDEVCKDPHWSQDAWVFRGWPPDVAADFPMGWRACDNRLARLLEESGYTVYNPSFSIKTHHLHADQREGARDNRLKIFGPYSYPPPCLMEFIRYRPADPIPKPGRVAIIQLGRLGDIVNSLPIAFDLHRQKQSVFWYVRPEFAPLLEAASYVTPVIWEGPIKEPGPAIEDARGRGYDRILALQVDGNPEPTPQKTESYSAESWVRGGCLDKFHILPCVLDRPQLPLPEWPPPGDKPILAYCLEANTSPYSPELKHGMIQWLRENFAAEFSLLEISAGKWRADSLAVILRQAAVLVSVDTFPLHMAYLAGTPTVAITARGWIGSEPRRNWIAQVSYDQSVTALGRKEMAAAIASVAAKTAIPGRLIRATGQLPQQRLSHARKLSILIAATQSTAPALKALLDRLSVQVKDFFLVETVCDLDPGPAALWQQRNKLLSLANGEYCCFIDAGDNVGESFVDLLVKALADRPDCVGFKIGRVADGKVQSVEQHTLDLDQAAPNGETVRAITHVCPVKTQIARKIGFGPGGDPEYAAKLAASGLLDSENFINAVIYFRTARE